MRRLLLGATAIIMIVVFGDPLPLGAASAFADPAFKTQWQSGEAIAPNFWGPLANAKAGQQESYKGASDGKRLVQYFDKGRMELTDGAVTNGLLATELLTGRLQLGDNSFEQRRAAEVAVAGDQGSRTTYAVISMVDKVMKPAKQATGRSTAEYLTSYSGSPRNPYPTNYGSIPYPKGAGYPQATNGGFDAVTQHNVPAAFVAYRNAAGLETIGYAITEPLWAPVNVGPAEAYVLVQVFERRVLTFTPDNPPDFQVEMGNVGQHYYRWRYQMQTSA
ncbi:MAG: hypothetical protein M3176_05865 [Chloroflexota bacterium]|nr:hypothetical protein [Chloroflexota bacterium]